MSSSCSKIETRAAAIACLVSALVGASLSLPPAALCAEPGGEPASAGSWLSLLLYIINFGLFVWILKRYASAPARKFFADRAAAIKENFARTEAEYKQAQDLARRAAERMARLEAEKNQLRADLDAETSFISGRIREMARETAARIVRDNELTAKALSEAARRQIRATLADAAGRLAREMIPRNFSDDDQRRLLNGFEEKLAQEARR
jgi:F-type H+-transporting ATPase subunit b